VGRIKCLVCRDGKGWCVGGGGGGIWDELLMGRWDKLLCGRDREGGGM
jgi:hypothetical protein